ncbi:MAG: HAMP domain-containing histidine kinase [Clostridiales bacterium]|nr:HAMP domain-containing histidine kinase [Clostridiales bacterium]
MFRKTKLRIIMSIMLVMVVTLAGTLAIIYLSSYRELYQSNQEMLETYISQYNQNGNPYESDREEQHPGGTESSDMPRGDFEEKSDPGSGNAPDLDDAQTYLLSTFYSVYFENGDAVSIDRSSTVLYSDEQLTEFAQEILALGKTDGIYGNLVYRVESLDEADLVVMMDNTIMGESITSLFRYTLIFGGIACVAIFLVALVLSNNIVRPVEQGYEKQKQFVSDAGHELKTPVAAISANIEALSGETGENKWLSNIAYENQRMAAMIRQLLLLSRTEGAPAEMERIDFSQLLKREILSFEAMAFEKGYNIKEDQVEDGISVKGNKSQLGQLVAILLDNAVEHANGQGRDIIISLTKSRNRAVLSISNPGEEITREQQKMIFERFYRVDEARSEDGNHFGLGLAIAKAIVETHHGSISVGCDKGWVTFTVTIKVLPVL